MNAEQALAEALRTLGFHGDPEMANTPARVAALLADFVPTEEPLQISRCATQSSGPVLVRSMVFHSLCAHHLLPFFGAVDVVYQPRETVVGLGSLPRAVAHFARRPQVQERMVDQLGSALVDAIEPEGLVVRCVARHMCVEMRGGGAPEVVVQQAWGETQSLLSML